MAATTEVTVVVPTYRRVRQPAPARRRARGPDARRATASRCVVVDNGSADDTPAVLASSRRRSPLRLRALRIDVNAGPGAGPEPRLAIGGRAVRRVHRRRLRAPPRLAGPGAAPPRHASPGSACCRGRRCGRARLARPGLNDLFRETLRAEPVLRGLQPRCSRARARAHGGFDESFPFGGRGHRGGLGRHRGRRPVGVRRDRGGHPRHRRSGRCAWHLMMAWREGNLVDVAAEHPALRRQGLLAPVGAPALERRVPRRRRWHDRGGGAAPARCRCCCWLPWIRLRRLPAWPPHGTPPRCSCGASCSDGGRVRGMVRASLRNRILVL